VHTTYNTPVYHKPKDECGGGSAWAAGIIDRVYQAGWANAVPTGDGTTDIFDGEMVQAIRRADLLAAMCQESVGDHSQVVRAELAGVENDHVGAEINLDTLCIGGAAIKAEIAATLATLKVSGVLAILRAKNADAAIARGIELVRCAFSDRTLHLRIPLDPTHVRLKQTCV
jgi:hypothetical protein